MASAPRVFSVARYAVDYARTLDHLSAWKLVLPEHVKEIVVSLRLGGREHEGTRLFLQQNVPQLKYHNPSVKFTADGHHDTGSEIRVVLGDGSSEVVETTGLRWQDIQSKINTLCSEHTSPLLPPPPPPPPPPIPSHSSPDTSRL